MTEKIRSFIELYRADGFSDKALDALIDAAPDIVAAYHGDDVKFSGERPIRDATYEHADGSLYVLKDPRIAIKCPTTGRWYEGVLYRGEDLLQRATTTARFVERFKLFRAS